MQNKEGTLEPGLKLDVGQQQEIAHGHPDLRQDSVFGGSQKRLDLQVLLDPLEEKLHLPARLVNGSDGRGGEVEIVGEELVGDVGLRIMESDQAKGLIVSFPRRRACQTDGFVMKQALF